MINNYSNLTIREFFILILGIIPMGYQIVNSFDLNSNYIYIGFILINILFLLSKKNNLPINKNILSTSGFFISAYILVPIVFNTIGNINLKLSLLYMGLFLLFITSLTIVTILTTEGDRVNILISSLVGNSLFLIYIILSNANQINFSNISSVINGNRFHRAYFSFSHPNTAAIFIFIEILLIYLVFINKYEKVKIGALLMMIFVIPMLATGSRTALYSLLLFFILEIFRKINNKISVKSKILSVYIILLPIMVIFYYKFNFTNFLNSSSGRNEFVTYNLKLVKDSGNLLTGFGPMPITSISFLLPSVAITDTWYVTHTLTFGLVSLVLIGINLFNIFLKFFKNNRSRNNISISLIIVLLFYSGAENVLFIPGNLLSWIFWLIIYTELKYT